MRHKLVYYSCKANSTDYLLEEDRDVWGPSLGEDQRYAEAVKLFRVIASRDWSLDTWDIPGNKLDVVLRGTELAELEPVVKATAPVKPSLPNGYQFL